MPVANVAKISSNVSNPFKNEDGIEKVLLIKKPQFESYDLPKGHKEGEETDSNLHRPASAPIV